LIESANANTKFKKNENTKKKLLKERDHVTNPQFDDKERKLVKLATKGVVTLFNAISEQQRALRKHEKEEERSRREKPAAISASVKVESLSKDGFIELLKSPTSTISFAPGTVLKKAQLKAPAAGADDNESDEIAPNSGKQLNSAHGSGSVSAPPQGQGQGWKVLSDGFMMGAKMTDWDKKEESDSDN